nr:BTAD domain-containing putative transcriptional regulator [Nocardia transvalensis]
MPGPRRRVAIERQGSLDLPGLSHTRRCSGDGSIGSVPAQRITVPRTRPAVGRATARPSGDHRPRAHLPPAPLARQAAGHPRRGDRAYRSGRRPDALLACHELRRMLDRELGLGPSVQLLQLQRQILRVPETAAA